jgi:hypothetical protein
MSVARKRDPNRVVRAIADAMWERDRLQMRAMDALLSAVAPPRSTFGGFGCLTAAMVGEIRTRLNDVSNTIEHNTPRRTPLEL